MPLFVAAPIVPATCVPWKELGCTPSLSPTSVGSGSRPSPSPALAGLEMKSKPGIWRPARSGWFVSPVSITATMTASSPVVMAQASGRCSSG
jgi:hypothetical protein